MVSTRAQRLNRGAAVTGINDLPSAVLDSIVSSLELPDAVRVSTVAKAWRNCWKVSRKLNFDGDFYDEFIHQTDYQLDTVINSILSRHLGVVDIFNVQFPSHLTGDSMINIREGIRILSRKEVKSLTIFLENHDWEHLELPDEIYNFTELVQLNLEHCGFKDAPAGFDGFHKLQCLTLSDVLVADNVMDLTMSRSPQLCRLELEFFEDGSPVEVRHPASDSLRIFYYKCNSDVTRPLRLSAFPNLVEAAFETELELPRRPFRTSKLEYFSSLIPRPRELRLGGSALASLADEVVPVSLLCPLQHVDELDFNFINIGSAEQLKVAFCLIRSCLDLETITLTVDADRVDHNAAMVELEAQQGSNPFPFVTNLFFKNVTGFFPIEKKFIETVSRLSPEAKKIRVWHGECISEEDIENIYDDLRHIQLPEGSSFLIDWNGEPELVAPLNSVMFRL